MHNPHFSVHFQNPTVYVNQDEPNDTSTCYFHFSQVKCFNNVLARIPVELREMVKTHAVGGVTDQDLFYNCLFHQIYTY
nr:hypothetical transcript [Hymenolepis microstoma]